MGELDGLDGHDARADFPHNVFKAFLQPIRLADAPGRLRPCGRDEPAALHGRQAAQEGTASQKQWQNKAFHRLGIRENGP